MTSPYLIDPQRARTYEELKLDLINAALDAQDEFGLDELEEYARVQRENARTRGTWGEGSEKP